MKNTETNQPRISNQDENVSEEKKNYLKLILIKTLPKSWIKIQ